VKVNLPDPETGPTRIGFLLLPQLPMMAFTSAVEPLRAANRLAGHELYQWRLYTLDGEPVVASNGITLLPHSGPVETDWPQLLMVCAGLDVRHHVDHPAMLRWLRAQARRGIVLGAISTGAYVLAVAGLLDGYRCTIHWENLLGLRESFPCLRVTEHVYEIDRDRYTCSGGTAALDLMLRLITRRHGEALATRVSEQFIHDRLRTPGESQRMAERLSLLRQSPRLAAAINLMAAHIEHPLPTEELAERSGLSLRQLERLFRKYRDCTPQQYYLRLRLQQARLLLAQTGLSVTHVALATGFASHSHFSKCYRECFGVTPQQDRRQPDEG
jgi:AraC family transcriptional regulator, glycine betaine-responsive activator